MQAALLDAGLVLEVVPAPTRVFQVAARKEDLQMQFFVYYCLLGNVGDGEGIFRIGVPSFDSVQN